MIKAVREQLKVVTSTNEHWEQSDTETSSRSRITWFGPHLWVCLLRTAPPGVPTAQWPDATSGGTNACVTHSCARLVWTLNLWFFFKNFITVATVDVACPDVLTHAWLTPNCPSSWPLGKRGRFAAAVKRDRALRNFISEKVLLTPPVSFSPVISAHVHPVTELVDERMNEEEWWCEGGGGEKLVASAGGSPLWSNAVTKRAFTEVCHSSLLQNGAVGASLTFSVSSRLTSDGCFKNMAFFTSLADLRTLRVARDLINVLHFKISHICRGFLRPGRKGRLFLYLYEHFAAVF